MSEILLAADLTQHGTYRAAGVGRGGLNRLRSTTQPYNAFASPSQDDAYYELPLPSGHANANNQPAVNTEWLDAGAGDTCTIESYGDPYAAASTAYAAHLPPPQPRPAATTAQQRLVSDVDDLYGGLMNAFTILGEHDY
ncbi:uncharacterized protein PHACADRAFT_201670 [Phanerochaete carnosa HHB-10118-sp]|uniref:Uncharacterized protein n=1 Tax=Phanerochaete carnosa (strain HHB-10118-sp) TaxID=650164 RepID=K5VE60_PHACS|nr:uncharacterized protein PHACADRAFT_201670 [Phanerochaete carnosa HHB-10118-sp]EKM49408.1 hypothetical protein PHACADRAFT_201670 [Phanerochaete carnosa HHB-10118-sp]